MITLVRAKKRYNTQKVLQFVTTSSRSLIEISHFVAIFLSCFRLNITIESIIYSCILVIYIFSILFTISQVNVSFEKTFVLENSFYMQMQVFRSVLRVSSCKFHFNRNIKCNSCVHTLLIDHDDEKSFNNVTLCVCV